MSAAITGTVHGKTISLDEAIPPFEGQRVRITLEPLPGADAELTVEEQARLLREWAAKGPQGPIEAGDQWPDES